MYKPLFCLFMICSAAETFAQNSAPPATRAQQIEMERMRKALRSAPDEPSKTEQYFDRTQDVIERSPIKIGVGGLGPGAGFTIGSELLWRSSSNQVVGRLWGSGSTRLFYEAGAGMDLPRLNSHGLSLGLEGFHRDAPQLEYYGSGPDSLKSNRTDYRREDTVFLFQLGMREHYHLTPTCSAGEDLLNVGPGTNSSFASTETVFSPAQAPGIDSQSNYLIGGCALQFDTRDLPEDPHKGTFAATGYHRYYAQDDNRFSFHRVSAVVEQYIPFLNRKRVIALRAGTELSYHGSNQVVPFYMQAILGGDSDLRGFRRYRFYDENSIVLNGEYRWEISTGFDMALFTDFGKVFNRPGQISLSHLQSDGGFGIRFKNRNRVTMRLDTGFSREGFQIWLKFGTLF